VTAAVILRTEAAAAPRERARLTVRGAVQGVGFRPFVYAQARALGLAGWIANTPQGVTIEVEGTPSAIAALIRALAESPPPNASVGGIETSRLEPRGDVLFAIRESALVGARNAVVPPDLATCEECLAEIRDPGNRRYRYPFTNCTHCGPRYSIIEDLPYDRTRTAMRRFRLCEDCLAEYEDPADRRFHAEPNACPNCGPELALWDAAGHGLAAGDEALLAAAKVLRRGEIVAVKGLGGFHLMVDARDQAAVERLRRRKHREEKPFAVMFPSLAAIMAEARVEGAEAALLTSRERPIVLLRRLGRGLADAVAPRNPCIGAMLPYTPLHHLLLTELDFPIVATSGNRSDEPIVADESEALSRLAGIADLFLVHDRPIVRAVDDSVVRIVAGRPQLLRRARGYAPAPIAAELEPGILALGGHQKTTIALTTAAGIVLSQHIGDLDSPEARDAYDRAVDDITRLHDTPPRLVVRDLHPDYHSTHVAAGIDAPVVAVQHHLAHVAACMAEHGLSPPLLGVAWDGTGYGPDGTVWGGEFLRVTEAGWRRVAHLRPFRLAGGEAAMREPRRAAIGLLFAAFGREALSMSDLAPVADFTPAERDTLAIMLERGVNAPVTTSAGRLFDAVASLAGLRQRVSYEGQAAAELEWAIGEEPAGKPYEFPVRSAGLDTPLILDWEPALHAILADLRAGAAPGLVSAAFHDGLALAIADIAARIGETTVALSGGCFQNARLTEATIAALRSAGLTPWWHERVPPNDGGLALGQAFSAARVAGGVSCA
jgi:hydrogenase maturation protein HypF